MPRFLVLCLLSATLALAADASRRPIQREGFFRAIEIGGLSSAELISVIADLGVDFQLTAEDRSSLAGRNVDPLVVSALEKHYRAPQPPEEDLSVKVARLANGPTLTQAQVLELLKTPSGAAVVAKLIELGKVNLAAPPPPPPPPAPAPEPKPEPKVQKPAAPVNQAVAALVAEKKVTPLVLKKASQPPYPPMARSMRVQGSVRLQLVVNEQGRVESARSLSGHALLAQAAVEAARNWVYDPATIGGVPTRVTTEVDVNFRLNQ
jgi:protein TonB